MSHESPTPNTTGRSAAVLIAAIGLLGLVLLLIAGLVFTNHDPAQVVYFASGPVAIGIISVVLGSRLDALKGTTNLTQAAAVTAAETASTAADAAAANTATLGDVSDAVNGQMSQQFAAIHKRLDYLGAPPAGAIGPSVPPRATPPAVKP